MDGFFQIRKSIMRKKGLVIKYQAIIFKVNKENGKFKLFPRFYEVIVTFIARKRFNS